MNNKHTLNLDNCAFGKGKVYNANNTPNPKPNIYQQENGTKTLNTSNVNNKATAIRGFDIGNNAKYDRAQQMAKNTTALPSSFWEHSESDTDSEEERIMNQDSIANQWKGQQSAIRNEQQMHQWTKEMKEIEDQQQLAPMHRGVKLTKATPSNYVYGDESSSDDEDNDEQYGFEKYVMPIPQGPKPNKMVNYTKPTLDDKYIHNNTKWIVHEQNKQMQYDMQWFKLAKMRNGKANGFQMKDVMESTGLDRLTLKKIWKLADIDKDGSMGNEEFSLCMFLIEKAKEGGNLPDMLPPNYVPPSFRGKALSSFKSPPKKKAVPVNTIKSMNLNASNAPNKTLPDRKAPISGYVIAPKTATNVNVNAKPQRIAPKIQPKQPAYTAPHNVQKQPIPQQRPVVYKPVVKTQPNVVQRPYSQAPKQAAPFGSAPVKPQTIAQPQQKRVVYTQQQTQTRQQPVIYKQAPQQRVAQPQVGQRPVYQQQGYNQNRGTQPQMQRRNLDDVDFNEMKQDAVKAAKFAGKHAKKAGVAALGWMAKKMNEVNDKVQDGKQNKSGYSSNQRQQKSNVYQKKY